MTEAVTGAAAGPVLSPRMRQLLDAAVAVVAENGLRGLTHRAVDRQARLPLGSCSAYLRTRKALVTALAEYVAARAREDLEGLAGTLAGCPGDEERANEVVTEFFMRWLDQPEVLKARMELTLEALRDPELAALLQAARGRLVGLVEGILASRGKDRSAEGAEALVASFDGILMAALPKPDAERRPFVRRSLEALLGGLG